MRSTLFFAALLVVAALGALLVARSVIAARRPGAATEARRRSSATRSTSGSSAPAGCLAAVEDRRQRPRRPYRRRGDRRARGRSAGALLVRRRQPRHQRSRRCPGLPRRRRTRPRADRPEPVRDLGDDLAQRQAGRRGNDVLRQAAAANHRLRLVEWAAMVQAHPDWLAGDHLHGNEAGYRERARAVAAATTSCTPAVNLTAQ